jgi:hypothetical protein
MKCWILLIPAVFSSFYAFCQSQEATVVGAAGQVLEARGVSLDWTLGEVAIEALENAKEGKVLLQGFHRSDLLTIASGKTGPSLRTIEVFPNPFESEITVKMSDIRAEVVIQIHDMQGRLLRSFSTPPGLTTTRLDLSGLPLSNYLLVLYNTATHERKAHIIQKKK